MKRVFSLLSLGLLISLCCSAAQIPNAEERANALSFVCPLGENAPAGTLHFDNGCNSPGIGNADAQAYCGLCVAVCYDVSMGMDPVQCWFNCMSAYGFYYLTLKQGPDHAQPVDDRSKPAWDLPPILEPHSAMLALRN